MERTPTPWNVRSSSDGSRIFRRRTIRRRKVCCKKKKSTRNYNFSYGELSCGEKSAHELRWPVPRMFVYPWLKKLTLAVWETGLLQQNGVPLIAMMLWWSEGFQGSFHYAERWLYLGQLYVWHWLFIYRITWSCIKFPIWS